ncbi:hypothetical protein P153DRAFT_434186 [Dothidotthia symphoricarpi CBS 119687]|uniref:ZZ-type domain-containing protein n=1 Tax=Dothidotthia symphoricarpi CBS 119687 TaxID=1392245 RepID=A0A6A6A3Q0_9PLEO|nr:uncharacterized protein P153DRAFT_434186 [Dothidotthia symphoricarpi CBS 119687]KAF2125744.1 hypothetical protein P153DRAFT_434186 [Dothidotthia symphoricarpi CBS 119687]
MAATNVPVTLDTPIVVKLLFRGQSRKLKLPLKDLGAHVLPDKLRSVLQLQPDEQVVFERYSDSAGAYVTLDSDKPQVYKTLFRAAKAKLKLRLKATIPGEEVELPAPAPPAAVQETARALPQPSSLHRLSAETLTPQVIAPISPVIARSPNANPPAPKCESASPISPPQPETCSKKLPRSFTARQSFFNDLANASQLDVDLAFHKSAQNDMDLAFRPKPSACSSWVVYCNNCNHPMEDEHFHCGICDSGDYDLCPACVDLGIHCPGAGHWMVKRFVRDGCVINSTTQRMATKTKTEEVKEVPGAFTDEKESVTYEDEEPSRTCNCCVKILPEKEFVTCTFCDDYDLCLDCHISNKHGHHPGHAFKAAAPEAKLPTLANVLCNTGRNIRHNAVCDGCDKFIYGVRHKCLNCPDWDYCSDCVSNAKFIHPRHRFVPIYEALTEPLNNANRHYGIFCDGPLCKDKENVSYIEGVRYKCAVCHDTDFCQNCEAHPSNRHNHTHPLIKLKTSVRHVSVTTQNDDVTGMSARLGDRQLPTATETVQVAPSTNAATQVQTIVDMKPSQEPQVKKEKIAICDLLVESAEPVQEKASVAASEITGTESQHSTYKSLRDVLAEQMAKTLQPALPVFESGLSNVAELYTSKFETLPADFFSKKESKSEELDAHFIRDTVVDGSKICLGSQFVQVWTLRNPGPDAWPAGCSVRHVGGDNMLNIDNSRALGQAELSRACESNVIDRSVEAGEEISFRVVLKAPQREGTAISYWRLKTAEGMPFGHRLWCDITVVALSSPTPAQPIAVPVSSSETVDASGSSRMYERILQARQERTKSVQQSHAQQLEQQKMERIQRVRKAAVERLMENRRRESEAVRAAMQQESAPKVEEPVKQEAAELPVEEKSVEHQAEPELQTSRMIFPQLDKESPESSTYESTTTAQPESPMSEKSTIARTVTVADDDEFFEDAESVALHSDDESFMTDEEYDILDASDEEGL